MADQPKILLYDIENAPARGWVWGKWQQDVIDFDDDWFMLCFAYKWLGEKKVRTVALPDFTTYDTPAQRRARLTHSSQDDSGVCQALWNLFNEADIVVSHNGVNFDQAKARARFVRWGFDPPSPFREVDTKKVAAKHFRFESNSLKDLCRFLQLSQQKEDSGGWQTWAGCIDGDPQAWRTMLHYNCQDVNALEEVFLKLRPWDTMFPNLTVMGSETHVCPKCGAPQDKLIKNGRKFTQLSWRQGYKCKACGGTFYGRKIERSAAAYIN